MVDWGLQDVIKSESKLTIPIKQATGTQKTFSLPLSNTRVHSAMTTIKEIFRTYLPATRLNKRRIALASEVITKKEVGHQCGVQTGNEQGALPRK